MPIIMYSPETGLGLGGGVLLTHRNADGPPGARPQSLPLLLIYTTKQQANLALAPEIYFDEERWALLSEMVYQNFPSSFFGVGPDTPEDSEEDITTEFFLVDASILRRVYSYVRVGITGYWRRTNVLETEAGGVYELWRNRGRAGGTCAGVGPAVEWDSRDDIFYPSRGGRYRFLARFYREAWGSDFKFETYVIDVRRYFTLRPSHILAFQVYGRTSGGEVPIDKLAKLGLGMRGIYASRFLDVRLRYPGPSIVSR